MAEQRLDIVIFGATGFTGKYAVNEVIRLAKEKSGLSWGVAGRNRAKLEELLCDIGNKTGEDLSAGQIIVADVMKEESLQVMASSARVIVNCAGPYRFYGEPVVKACIASGTHHVDVSGEPAYMEKMQLNYHKAAEEKGVYIVSACGFDSIPADMGIVFLQQKFEGIVNSVETYLQTKGSAKNAGHYGTWASLVHSIANQKELRPLRRALFPNRLPERKPKQKPRPLVHRTDAVEGWCLPFPGADRSVMIRSQRHFYENLCMQPVQIQTYMAFPSITAVLAVFIVGVILSVMSRFTFGRSLLLKYPKIFSLGALSHDGPSEDSAENTDFSLILKGEGWTETLSEPTDQFAEPPNKKMVVKVSGKNPAYGATCTMLVMCAFMILTESDKMPGRGGVYPPGAAFARTSLIKQLTARGVKFEVISSL